MEFEENQRFTQWWLWSLLIGVTAFPVYGIYKQIILGEPYGDNPMSDTGLIVFALQLFALLALFFFIRLKTRINSSQIKLVFFPFVRKKVGWSEVKEAKIVEYSFVGFGIRLWTKNGTVYNIRGNKGLAIELKNGKKFLIGTQKESALQDFLSQLRSKG